MTRLLTVGASCALAGFLAGIVVCYFWIQIQSSPVATNIRGVTSETELAEAGAGGTERAAPGNINARATKFEALDLDRDGKLNLTEFSGDRKSAEAARWFERRDVNRDGLVSRQEFLPVMPLSEPR